MDRLHGVKISLIPIYRNNQLENVYWTFSYNPVKGETGKVAGVLVTCFETTEKVQTLEQMKRNEADLQRQREALIKSEENFKSVITQSPVAMGLFKGPDMVIEVINDPFLTLWGKGREVIGKPLLAGLPELIGQPYFGIMQEVMRTGMPYFGNEAKVALYRNGKLDEGYYNFINQPFRDKDGEITGIIVVATEVTEQVTARQAVSEINIQLEMTNQKLKIINEELAAVEGNLQDTVTKLQESDTRLRYMLSEAPVAIAVLTGDELIVESANKKMLELWGKPSTILGKPLQRALPELKGQPFLDILDEILISGRPFFGNEMKASLAYKNEIKDVYCNFVYHPLTNPWGQVINIMVVATIVTEQVIARMELQKEKDKLNLAVMAAELGTFDMDIVAGTMDWDNRCRLLFGINHKNPVTYEQDFVKGLHPEDRERVTSIIEDVFVKAKTNGDYDVEYRTIGAADQKVRWVRAKGKAYFNESDQPLRFIGTVLDITEQKMDEIRKNDFISMVSHELKTPLTSLSAYIQLLHARSIKEGYPFFKDTLIKAIQQTKRMSKMIDGFLDISRVESGKLHLHKTHFNAPVLIAEIIEEIKPIAVAHTIKFIPCEPIMVFGDREKIGSVISNLLSNAIKYSPDGTPIIAKCEQRSSAVVVSIQDSGIGISEGDLQRLFERFYRVETDYTRQINGFGIGLYLSAEIIKIHGGQIWGESEQGTGSTFYFTLPVV